MWFPVCPLKEALLYGVGQLGARSLSAVRNQGASARGRLIISSVVISIGATASVRNRDLEVVRSLEGPLWEVPLWEVPL